MDDVGSKSVEDQIVELIRAIAQKHFNGDINKTFEYIQRISRTAEVLEDDGK